MTDKEFNEKYKEYIEDGFIGLEFDIPIITEFLDLIFTNTLTEIENFQFSQIKIKYDNCRFHSNLPQDLRDVIESIVNVLIKVEYAKRNKNL